MGKIKLDDKTENKMIPENELLFICARKNFQIGHQKAIFQLCDKFKIKWDVVYSTTLQHQVTPLIYRNLLQCKDLGLELTPDVITKFKSNVIMSSLNKLKLEQDIVKILSYFNKKSVDVMLIKGAALNFTVYPNFPGYFIGDIDLILRNHREEITDQEDQEDVHFLKKINTLVEWERFQHHDVNRNETLPINFKKIWDNAKEMRFKGEKVLVMSPEDMLLTACINSCRKRFFRLKSLCDIIEIINYFPQLDWEVFVHRAKEYRCHHIVYTSLLVTSLTSKYNLPKEVLRKLNVSRPRATLIRLVVKYLYNYVSLNSLLPSSGRVIFGKNVNPALVLNFITCNWLQFLKAIHI